jgi:hypothetical protein
VSAVSDAHLHRELLPPILHGVSVPSGWPTDAPRRSIWYDTPLNAWLPPWK